MEDTTKARPVEVADNLRKTHLDADGKVLDAKLCKTAIANAPAHDRTAFMRSITFVSAEREVGRDTISANDPMRTSPPSIGRSVARNSLKECLFRKLIVGRPSRAIAMSLVSSGVAPKKAVSGVLTLEVGSEPTTKGMTSHAR